MNLAGFNTVKKIRDGDIREFEHLFSTYYEPLCRHANQVLGDMSASEDIVQEFFYNLWKNRQTMNATFSLSAYLFRSVHNNALHYLSHQAVKQRYEDMKEQNLHVQSGDTGNLLEWEELDKAVELTLSKLPERCARVFRLNRFEGKKYREIAAMLSISIKTVEADMGRALREFRENLAEYTGSTVAGELKG